MRAGIFGRPGLAPMGAVARGVAELGYEPVFQRPQVWHEYESQDFDLVVTMGLRLHSGGIADHYKGKGVPVLVVDLPPIRRAELWAVWPGEINKLPDEAPTDRLHLVEFAQSELGDRVLVCGQKPDDAAHRMDSATLADYFGRTVSLLKIKHPGRVVWRPHPQHPSLSFSVESSNPDAEPLSAALRGCGALVTYNSTCGIEAILAGIPVYCDPSSFYRELTAPGLPELDGKDPLPTFEEKQRFFARLTHCVWSETELATARPYRETLGRGR